jgi:NhaA family Na+:H+ antiporter
MLGIAALILVAAAAANAAGVRRPAAYALLGIALWGAVLASGIHATIAGVLLATAIPVRTRVNEAGFLDGARRTLEDFDAAALQTARDPDATILSNSDHHTALEELETLTELAQPPLIRMEHALHGLVSFAIMPLFALANAGVSLDAAALRQGATSSVTVGALVGLLAGKPIGIAGFSWLAVKFGFATLPAGVTRRMLIGAGILGGIGFTMALFIAGLAFADERRLDAAKLGVLSASIVAGIAGYTLLRQRAAE